MAHLSLSVPTKIIIQTCPSLLPKIYFNLPLLVIVSVALLYIEIRRCMIRFIWDSFRLFLLLFAVVQLLSHVWLWVPMTTARQASPPILHYLLEFAQTHVHRVSDAHPTTPFSVACFSSRPQSFPASGSFPMSRLFTPGGQSIGAIFLFLLS